MSTVGLDSEIIPTVGFCVETGNELPYYEPVEVQLRKSYNHQIIELPSIFIIPCPAWDEVEDAFTYKYIDSIVEKPSR